VAGIGNQGHRVGGDTDDHFRDDEPGVQQRADQECDAEIRRGMAVAVMPVVRAVMMAVGMAISVWRMTVPGLIVSGMIVLHPALLSGSGLADSERQIERPEARNLMSQNTIINCDIDLKCTMARN
jgi:hypothetical protein